MYNQSYNLSLKSILTFPAPKDISPSEFMAEGFTRLAEQREACIQELERQMAIQRTPDPALEAELAQEKQLLEKDRLAVCCLRNPEYPSIYEDSAVQLSSPF